MLWRTSGRAIGGLGAEVPMFIWAVLAATLVWFVLAAILFFNPVVDKIYATEEKHPSVKVLPKNSSTIGKILLAVFVQSVLWAWVFGLVKPALDGTSLQIGLLFGFVLVLTKIIPRDIDRMLLTTYPPKRMTIEFVIGIVCALAVGIVFGYMI